MILPPLLLVGLGTALVRGVFLGYPEKIVPDARLTAKEQAIVAAVADTLFPKGGPIPISGTEAGLVAYMDAYVQRLPTQPAVLVRLLFQFLEHGPWIFGLKRRFTSLTHEQRLEVLEGMRTSPIYFRRVACLSMRAMLTMGYLAHPEVTKAMRMTAKTNPFGLGDEPHEKPLWASTEASR
jgi:hypothetical protein